MEPAFERLVEQRRKAAIASLGADIRRLREDAAITRAALARAVGLDPSYLREIEEARANPSIQTCVRLSLGLGADFPMRLYPTTGPALRDRHQAPIAEATLAALHRTWQSFGEVAVRHPARGWIDLGLHSPRDQVFVATEIQSEIRRLEQLIRWAEAKALALPSWEGWTHLGDPPEISRLLIVRETRGNRAIASEYRRVLRAAYPADPRDALDALRRGAAWPGAAVLWAARDRELGGYRLSARP